MSFFDLWFSGIAPLGKIVSLYWLSLMLAMVISMFIAIHIGRKWKLPNGLKPYLYWLFYAFPLRRNFPNRDQDAQFCLVQIEENFNDLDKRNFTLLGVLISVVLALVATWVAALVWPLVIIAAIGYLIRRGYHYLRAYHEMNKKLASLAHRHDKNGKRYTVKVEVPKF